MQKAKCVEKIKDKHGNILQYKIMFVGGVIQTIAPDYLRTKMRTGEWDVINLKFTSDGRLIDAAAQSKPTPMPVTKPTVTQIVQPVMNGVFVGDLGPRTTDRTTVNPMQFVGDFSSGLVNSSQPTAKEQHVKKEEFNPKNLGDIYSKFEELIFRAGNTPWQNARDTDKMNWVRILWKRWQQDNKTDIIFELKKIITNADKTLPKHRYLVIGYGHYSIDKDKFVFEDTVDNIKYDYSMLYRAVKNYCDRRGKNVRQDIIEDWVLNLTAQAVDADIDDSIEEIVQGLINESYID